jgi:hypothetical protein
MRPTTCQIGKFTVSYDGTSVVTITADASSDEEFDLLLDEAQDLLRQFKRSHPGSDWGCDGIGYVIQREKRLVRVHRSGVGPRVFSQTLRTASIHRDAWVSIP